MDQLITVSLFAVVIFVISLIASRLPFFIKKDIKQLHRLIAFSAGVMIGVLFIMLLPEALERTVDAEYDFKVAAYMILIGFMLIFVIDFLVKKHMKVSCSCHSCQNEHTHDITSLSAFAGLSIHSFFDGLALAAAFIAGEDVGVLVLIAMCLHKAVVIFSLSSTMLMSKNRKSAWKYLIAFSAISPIATVVSYLCLDGNNMAFAGPALCFSVGIFMFVALCDMLPEAFHNRERDSNQVLALFVGLVIVAVVAYVSELMMGGIDI